MEIKFCPQCGTLRQGAFCGGCGVRYESFFASVSPGLEPAVASPQTESLAEETTTASELQQVSFTVPFGMRYGETFDQSQDCWNCGAESDSVECELCGFSRP